MNDSAHHGRPSEASDSLPGADINADDATPDTAEAERAASRYNPFANYNALTDDQASGADEDEVDITKNDKPAT